MQNSSGRRGRKKISTRGAQCDSLVYGNSACVCPFIDTLPRIVLFVKARCARGAGTLVFYSKAAAAAGVGGGGGGGGGGWVYLDFVLKVRV